MTYILEPYDDALRQILKDGVKKENRTGVNTYAIFGMQSRYKIDEYWPLITGRKINPQAVLAEMLWFVSGSTNNEDLKKLGASFWTPWVDRQFEIDNGYAQGSLGPLYGFQLRHWNGYYGKGINTTLFNQNLNELDQHGSGDMPVRQGQFKYGRGGIDQLQYVINKLKSDPNCRRILWNLWNPNQINKMRLAPCHYSMQFFVHEGKLSGVLTQRSCDFPVGVPFNIAFYSALIYMIAQQTNLEPYEFVHWTADSHIYEDQIPAVEEYLAREKPDSPKLEIKIKPENINGYKMSYFDVKDYNPLPPIRIPVAV